MPMLKSSVPGRRVVAVSVSLLALAIAGCGSSSPSGLGKAALASKAQAICKRHNDVITAAASKMLAGGKLPSKAKFGQLAFGTIIPQTTAQIAELTALKPQTSLSSSYKQWLATFRAVLARMKQNPIAIQSSATFASLNQEAKALGFSSACHAGPGS